MLTVARKDAILVYYWKGEGNKTRAGLQRMLQVNVLCEIIFELHVTGVKGVRSIIICIFMLTL